MFSLPEILNQLQIIQSEAALLGLFVTAGIILIARDWRFLIMALLAQYILVGIILSRLVRPDIAVLSVLIGAFICPILFLSARQVAVNPLSILAVARRQSQSGNKFIAWWQKVSSNFSFKGDGQNRSVAPTGFGFRVFIGLVMILVTLTLSSSFPLPALTPAVTTGVYWLVLAGLVVITLTEDPMKVGHGLLTLLSGFGLFYITLERSFLLIGLWGSVNLLIALAIGYLTVVKGAGTEEGI